MQNAIEQRGRGRALEGQSAGRHLVQHRPERKEVGAGIEFLAKRLLGRHIGDRAHGSARTGEMDGERRRSCAAGFKFPVSGRQLCQTEIEDLRLATIGDKDISRLDVAVKDVFAVRGIERIGELDGQIKQLIHRQRLTADLLIKGHAFQKLHRNEVLAFELVNLINGADIGMVQRGGGASFPLQAVKRLLIFFQFLGKEFQRDVTAEFQVFGFIDHPHAARTQLTDNLVVRNRLPNHGEAVGKSYCQMRRVSMRRSSPTRHQ